MMIGELISYLTPEFDNLGDWLDNFFFEMEHGTEMLIIVIICLLMLLVIMGFCFWLCIKSIIEWRKNRKV